MSWSFLLIAIIGMMSWWDDLVTATPYRGRYYDEFCTDPETGRELYVGEAFTRPGQCIRVQCLGSLQIWEDRCQIPKLEGNCTQLPPENEYLNYPICCPMYQCKKSSSNGSTSGIDLTEEIHTYDHYGNIRRSRITQMFEVNGQLGLPGRIPHVQFEIKK